MYEIYKKYSMVKAKHIKEIDKQLKNFKSKVRENLLDGQEHCLKNILYLACHNTSYKVKIEDINSIYTNEFKIKCNCED